MTQYAYRAERDGWTLGPPSRREMEVALLLADGYSNKQIAFQLGISERTVKIHRKRAMQKFRAASFADMVRRVDRVRAQLQYAFCEGSGI